MTYPGRTEHVGFLSGPKGHFPIFRQIVANGATVDLALAKSVIENSLGEERVRIVQTDVANYFEVRLNNESNKLVAYLDVCDNLSWPYKIPKRDEKVVNLTRKDIAIAELVSAFVKFLFPKHEIVGIAYESEGVPEEGFFPTVTICPHFMHGRPDTFVELNLNVWISDLEYVKLNGQIFDARRTDNGTFEFELSHIQETADPS